MTRSKRCLAVLRTQRPLVRYSGAVRVLGGLNFESDQIVGKAELLASAKAASCKPVSTRLTSLLLFVPSNLRRGNLEDIQAVGPGAKEDKIRPVHCRAIECFLGSRKDLFGKQGQVKQRCS